MKITIKYIGNFCGTLTLAVASLASAEHPVVGETFEIGEPDMRLVMMSQAAEKNWGEVRERLVDQARNPERVTNGYRVPETTQYRVDHYDPSVVAQKDISGLMRQDDGSYEWEVIVAEGTKANPLERIPAPAWMFVFDPADPQQRRLARDVVTDSPTLIRPVVTRGNAAALASEWGQPVYNVQDWHFERFGVQYAPSLVGVHPDRPLRIRTVAFPMPVDAERVYEELP